MQTEKIKNLIYSISQNKAVESENTFNSLMNEKVVGAIDNMRTNIAKNLFKRTK